MKSRKGTLSLALGRVIPALREEQGLRQEELARRTGVGAATISFAECRLVDPY